MTGNTIGFIGGGRVTRIILEGFKRKGKLPEEIIVSDTNIEILNGLKERFPQIRIFPNDNTQPALMDIVFVALHPPVVSGVLGEIKTCLKADATIISLVPMISITSLSELLGEFQRIVRMIPNAPSVVNAGYNPVAFSRAFTEKEKDQLINILSVLGECPEVAEEKLEAYAILTAMGPTYLWFQLCELQEIGKSFGLTSEEVADGISKMVQGTAKSLFESGLSSSEVMDLVPVKPLGDEEENITNIYRTKLEGLYKKLKG
ncbi:MAG: NAD(P)-binding domain-containing protein [Syntrophales bacterium]|nr:NAD(P)-binding domain-containing protein [Syntrophales bacterium]